MRRDFTANALYYAIEDFSVRDYVGGFEDVQARVLRLIGDPEHALPRRPGAHAARGAAGGEARLRASTPAAAEPIPRLAALLSEAAPARLFDECAEAVPVRPCRGAASSGSSATACCRRCCPETAAALAANRSGALRADAAARRLRSTDARVAARQAGDAGLPVRRAAVAGLLPRTDGACRTAGIDADGRAAARRRPRDAAPGRTHRAAAPLLAADAGDLAAAVALRRAPAQARDAPADAPAFPRGLRFPRTARSPRPRASPKTCAFWREAQEPGSADELAGGADGMPRGCGSRRPKRDAPRKRRRRRRGPRQGAAPRPAE